VQRVPVAWIVKNMGGWKFPKVPFSKGRKFYLVIMTMPVKPPKKVRVNGHMGLYAEDAYGGSALMAHASYSKGFIAIVVDSALAVKWKAFGMKTY
jgi:hypothetical protein